MKRLPMKELGIGAGIALFVYLGLKGLNVMPVLLVAALMIMLLQMPGMRTGARKVATANTGTVPGVRFEDIGGQASAKKELLEAIDFITQREKIEKMGIRPLKGILLTGPPGTGKTLLAKAAAHHTNSVFVAAAGSDFVEMYAGVGAQRVREMFRKARETARRDRKSSAVVFIDEIDVLGARRGAHASHMEYDQTLNQLLVEMDGLVVDQEVQLLVMAATNRADMLDPALLRPGRFDRLVNVDLPDKAGRLAILELHTKTKPLAPNVDLEGIARQTFGFSGAHLESLANEAAILALRDGEEQITMRHLTEAVDKVILGERLDRKPAQAEKERVAFHETGHALVGEWVEPGSVSTITITPRGRAMGYVRTNPADDRYLYTRTMLEGQMRIALGGFVAEEMIFGEGSTGASGDFARVVELAKQIVAAGMSSLGIIDPNEGNKPEEARVVQEIIREQQARVRWYLEQQRPLLEQVAPVLVRDEVIDGDELRQMLQEAPPLPPEPQPADEIQSSESPAPAADGGADAQPEAPVDVA